MYSKQKASNVDAVQTSTVVRRCVVHDQASRHVPVNGYIDTRMGEVASTAKNMVENRETLSSYWRKTSDACRYDL